MLATMASKSTHSSQVEGMLLNLSTNTGPLASGNRRGGGDAGKSQSPTSNIATIPGIAKANHKRKKRLSLMWPSLRGPGAIRYVLPPRSLYQLPRRATVHTPSATAIPNAPMKTRVGTRSSTVHAPPASMSARQRSHVSRVAAVRSRTKNAAGHHKMPRLIPQTTKPAQIASRRGAARVHLMNQIIRVEGRQW